jgi:UDP-glucose 4-epimerase
MLNTYDNLSSQMDITLVTGGAGFIGSHIVDRLLYKDVDVKVLDNLSTGNISNLSSCMNDKRLHFLHGDLRDLEDVKEALEDAKTVFHIASYPEVRTGFDNPKIAYEENIRNTFYLLEEIRKSKVDAILFTSSSTVYGEPGMIPTPEDYGPLLPISPYGASKLACEALLSSYCHTYGMKGLILRLANIIGSRSRHGVIWDFIRKLRIDNKKLEILGNGLQTKSYLHVSDCVDCFFFCISKSSNRIEIFNVGNNDRINVTSLAKIVCNTMHLVDVELVTTDGIDNGRGWIGDVKNMQLGIEKLKRLGWGPSLSSINAVTQASKEILEDKI